VTVYSIRNWGKLFENSRSRQIEALSWVPMPNAHDGSGFVELIDHADGAAHYGCWALIVQVSSKCHPRGTLVKSSGEAHTPESIAKVVRVPVKTMRTAMERLVTIGWLHRETSGERQPSDTQVSSECHPPDIEGTEGKEGKEEKKAASPEFAPALPEELSGSKMKIVEWLKYKA